MSETGLSDPGVQVFHTRHSVSQSRLDPQRSHHSDWSVEITPILHQFPLPAQRSALNMRLQSGCPREKPTWTCLQHVFHHRNWPFWWAYFSRKQTSLLSRVLALASHNWRRRAAFFFYWPITFQLCEFGAKWQLLTQQATSWHSSDGYISATSGPDLS